MAVVLMEEFQIETYNRQELDDFILSDQFASLSVLPISFHRALSHINNPRLHDEDVILVVAWKDGQVAGYRTAMADYLVNGRTKVKVAWISGTWVSPEHRMKGLAKELFKVLHDCWNGRLVYTNYAPVSKVIYDKTGVFEEYKDQPGFRYYLRSNTFDILPVRYNSLKRFKGLLRLFDRFFNAFVLPLFTEPVLKPMLAYSFLIKSNLNEEEIKILSKDSLSNRGKVEFDWILTFPWVLSTKRERALKDQKYFFSSMACPFDQYFAIAHKNDVLIAIVMFTVKEKQLKIPYFWTEEDSLAVVAEMVFSEAWKHDISHIDIFQSELAKEMNYKRGNFLFRKQQERKYMVSKEIVSELPDPQDIILNDGEGDVVFV